MKQSIQKLPILWVLGSIFGLLIVFWQDFDATWKQERPGIIHFFDRHWLNLKQKLENEWIGVKKPWSKIHIYEPYFENRSEFWLEDEFRRKLYQILKDYPGLIIMNVDPNRLARDHILSPLLQKKNFIRGFYFSERKNPDLEIEEKVQISAPDLQLPVLNDHMGMIPSALNYYDKDYRYANLGYLQDKGSQAAQFILNYPLVMKGARHYTATAGLSLFSAHHQCDELVLESNQSVSCDHLRFQNPLTLFFYRENFPTYNRLEDIRPISNLLIINPVDESSEISSASGAKMTWATLVATSVSNMEQHHFPWRSSQVRFAEILVFVFFLSVILYYSIWGGLVSCLSVSFLSLLGLLLLDLLLSLYLGARTHPVESFISLLTFGMVGVSLRSTRDLNERRLIERALSGYVSEDRLKRLLSGRDRLQLLGRNREMTTLLLDIVGFSKISKSLGHQQVFQFVQDFFKFVDPIIFKYGGTIDKKTGDGLLAFFGDYEGDDQPQEAARSAILAALEIQRKLKEVQERNPQIFGLSEKIFCRVGVNSGSLMVGNAGSERHFNYTVLGESVNFTQRLEAACPPGEVLIGETSLKLVGSYFETSARKIPVKNETDLYEAALVHGKTARSDS